MDPKRTLWGVYAVGGPSWLPAGSIDFYYLGFHERTADYVQGTGREIRHTVGTRLSGNAVGWDWNAELAYQFGKFDGGAISAWTVATEVGRSWRDAPLKPRFAISTNIASGDRDPNDRKLATFNPLFPRGNYFDELALLGPRNFYNVHAFITISPLSDVSLTADWNFYWRLETGDGVYSPSGRILRRPSDTNARFVGSAVSLNANWQINRHLAITGIYTHFFPGEFIRRTGPANDIDFAELTLKVQF